MTGEKKTYKYDWRLLLPLYIASPIIPFALYVGYGVWAVGLRTIGTVFVAFGLLMLFVILRAHYQLAMISVDSEGVEARRFGRVLKHIPWRGIRKVSRVREYDPTSHKFRMTFYVLDTDRKQNFHIRKLLSNTRRGAILFEERLLGVKDLLNTINQHASELGIEIVEVDREADSQRGKTLWQKAEPAEHEKQIRVL